MEMAEGEGSTEEEKYDIDIATTASSLGGSGVFHIINDILGFVLYMHQQIPSYVIFLFSNSLYMLSILFWFDVRSAATYLCSISRIRLLTTFNFTRLIS